MRSIVSFAIAVAAAVLLSLLGGSDSVAQSARNSPEKQAEKAVVLRQALFRMINYGYAPFGDMLKDKVPFDAAVAQKSATLLVTLAPLIGDVFKVDTRQFNLKTWASDDIWTQKLDYQAKSDSFLKAAGALADVAKAGDRKAILQAAAAVGRSCSACHDEYTP